MRPEPALLVVLRREAATLDDIAYASPTYVADRLRAAAQRLRAVAESMEVAPTLFLRTPTNLNPNP